MPESHFKFAHTHSIIVNNSRTCLLLFTVMFVHMPLLYLFLSGMEYSHP